jgi:hypothetical protein
MLKSSVLAGLCVASLAGPVLAQSNEAVRKIPDFSGGWGRIGALVETYEVIPGSAGGRPQTVDPKHPHIDGAGGGTDVQWISSLDNPTLKPETLAKLKAITEYDIAGISHIKDEGVCRPSGVPMLLNRRGSALQMLQTGHEVIIMNARDQQIRHIYLDVPHAKNPGHSGYGESVGHYEGGDTLVVDTVGQNDLTQVDRFGTPHSDQIHVVERYKLSPDGKTIEVQFTVDDPGAFTMPWSGMARFTRRELRWEEEICAENNRFVGSVTYRGVVYKGNVPTPVDLTPDF